MGLSSFSGILKACGDEGKDFFRIVLEAQCRENGCTEDEALHTRIEVNGNTVAEYITRR